jgi:hypothetical protein
MTDNKPPTLYTFHLGNATPATDKEILSQPCVRKFAEELSAHIWKTAMNRSAEMIELALGHDPDKVIMEKIAYNKTRGYKHDKLA